MAKSETYFQKRLHKLTDFDSIRKLKILEIFQYNFFGFILVTIFAHFMNKQFFNKTYTYFLDKRNNKDNYHLGFITLCAAVMLETFIIIMTLFYIRKILLLMPSISANINKDFVPLTEFNNIVSITLSFLFIQFLSGYRGKMSLILDYEFKKHF